MNPLEILYLCSSIMPSVVQSKKMAPRKIGRYEIKSELGRGGMATVYLARDPRFGRDVAVKVLPGQFLHDPKFRARFEREANVIASLEHPFIVPVYDFGEEGGQPYLVMRFMPGGSLRDKLKSGPLSIDETSRMFAQMCQALSEAHGKGMIHRDLKPGNILFDRRGNAHLSDFGIVKLAEATASITGTGIVGTPAYMSPEQIQAEQELDGRSDIYSLGAMLFEMLAGKPPYQADTPIGLVMMHVLEPIPRILEVKPDLPLGCEALIGRAMAKNRNQRYATVEALAKAVGQLADEERAQETLIERPDHWPESEEVSAETVDELVDYERSIRRPRFPWSQVMAGVVLLAAIGIAIWQFAGGSAPTTPTPAASTVALTAPTAAVTPPPAPTATLANTSIPTQDQAATPVPVVIISDNIGQVRRLVDLRGHLDPVRAMAWSPNGSRLASASEDGTVRIWDTSSGEALRVLEGSSPSECDYCFVGRVAWSPDGTMLALAGEKFARVWDVEGEQVIHELTNQEDQVINGVAWSPDGSKVAFGSWDPGWVRILDIESWLETLVLEGSTGWVKALAWSPDGTQLAVGNISGSVQIRDAISGRQIRNLEISPSVSPWGVQNIAWSPDGGQLAASGWSVVRVWDTLSGDQIAILGEGLSSGSLGWSPDGRLLAAGSSFLVNIWDPDSGEIVHTFTGSTIAEWSPDGKRIAVALADGTISIRGILGE